MVGRSGNVSERVAVLLRARAACRALRYSIAEGLEVNVACTCPPSKSVSAGGDAAIRHMQHVDAGHHLEQLARHMRGGSDTTRRHGELARIGPAVGDEFANARCRKR